MTSWYCMSSTKQFNKEKKNVFALEVILTVLLVSARNGFIIMKWDAATLTSALKVSSERASTFRDAISVSEPEPTAESMVPMSSSSFCRVYKRERRVEFVGE